MNLQINVYICQFEILSSLYRRGMGLTSKQEKEIWKVFENKKHINSYFVQKLE